MSDRRVQAIGASLFLVIALAGWAPHFIATAVLDIYPALSMLLGGVLAIFAAGFTYDAGEKMFGEGRGIYASVVLLTFPLPAIMFSEPPLLSYTSMLFIVAACSWFAARATKETWRESLFFIVLLSGLALAIFGPWPPALLSLLTLLMLREKVEISKLVLLGAAGISLIGITAKSVFHLPLPDIGDRQPDVALNMIESAALLAPWAGFTVLTVFAGKRWAWLASAGIVTLAGAHTAMGGEWIGLVGASAPLIALGIAATTFRWFEAETEGRLRAWRWSVLPLVVVLILFAALRIAKSEELIISRNYATVGLLIAGLLTAAVVRDARRWVFALCAVAGLFAGGLWWYYWQDSIVDRTQSSFDLAPWISIGGLLALAFVKIVYGRRMPRALRAAGVRHRFDAVVFRQYSDVRRKAWEGDAVELAPKDPAHVQFIVFGDVAGAESPLGGRNSGYFAFLKLSQCIDSRAPEFAVSTGDLAVQATHLAYRRVRKMLRKISVPLIATPGNHDIVHQREVRSQFFHALFGSDHGDISFGPVRMILINNAWGSLTDEQFGWVERTFATPTSCAHTIVFCHKPIFDPREDTFYGMEWRPHAERLHELFAKHSVAAVFSGHIHSLLHTEKDGVNYIISGGGGSKLKTEDDEHHYLWCDVTREKLRVTAYGLKPGDPLFELAIEARR
jgi:hypothetical protein